jgi:hypothetical protein
VELPQNFPICGIGEALEIHDFWMKRKAPHNE